MVGIVLVSHSRELSIAVKALADQQIQGRAPIVAVGGSDNPHQPFGTDPVAIAEAIQAVFSEDGVLVLMDLGSAVISGQVALDLLEPEQAARVRLSVGPFVEGAMAAAVQASIGMGLEAVAREAEEASLAKQAVLEYDDSRNGSPDAWTAEGEQHERAQVASADVIVVNPAGLHFGPAARFIQTAAGFHAEVRVTNVTTGAGPAHANRFNQLLSLGIEKDHCIRIDATGRDAESAVNTLVKQVAHDVGESVEEAPVLIGTAIPPAIEGKGRAHLTGLPASPGIAIGTAVVISGAYDPLRDEPRNERASGAPAAEWTAFQAAHNTALDQLDALTLEIRDTLGEERSIIFRAHMLLLQDRDFLADIHAAIEHEGWAADAAVRRTVLRWSERFRKMSGAVFQQRAADVEDVGRRLLQLLRQETLPAIELPEYYSSDIDLSVEVDRGDVWYEFPYDAEGRERAQPVSRRPHTTIYAQYRGQRIALARFGTTVGGWRSDNVGGRLMWRYKNSPAGPRVWSRIIASPVWLPPDSSPPRGLLVPAGGGRFEVNYDETGPSYASAYGLVAAYHQLYSEDPEGNIRLGGDQGIRMHGSVDYMSIMRRHSHGCHRLHNHIAVRLMSFVLRHRPHSRRGQQVLGFRRNIEFDGRSYPMAIDAGGYVFRLERPLPVNVLEGRVLGAQLTPIEHEIPKYDPEVGAYVMPDGQWVTVDRHGNITPREMPVPLEGTVEPGTEGIVGGPAVGDAADEAAEGLISGEDDQTTTPAGPAPSARPAAPGASPAAPAAAPTMAPGTPSPSPQSAAAHGGGASPRAATLTTTTPPRAP